MKHTFLRVLCLLCAVVLLSTFALTGCGQETPAAEEKTEEQKPDASKPTTEKASAHNHKEPSAMRITYDDEQGGTFTLIIKDCKGNVVFMKKNLAEKASLSQQVIDGVTRMAWVTSNKPGGYECLYINRKTCQVSDIIAGEQVADGARIVYTEVKDGKLTVTVRDLFNKNGYCKTTEIEGAYTAGEYAVLGAVRVKDQVNISYLTDKDGGHRIQTFDLYENGEKTTKTTNKTEAKK